VDYNIDSVNPVICPALVNFTNYSNTSYYTGYIWTFGDGTSSTAFSPSHTYTTSGVYTVQIYGTNIQTGCLDSVSSPSVITVNCSTTGVQHIDLFSFRVYPNPSEGIYFIESSNRFNYEVTDVLGRKIMSGISANDRTQLNLNGQQEGVYFLKIRSEGISKIVRLILAP